MAVASIALFFSLLGVIAFACVPHVRASRVIVLEDGYVAEEGSPQELMTRDSRFNRLFEAQMFEKAAA